MKKLALLLAAVLLLGTLAACGGGAADDEILIGGLAPLTGDVAMYGIAVQNGAELAFEEINEAGGILGKQIKYEVLDEKGDSAEAVNAYNRLMEKDLVALLGDVTSKPTLAVGELAGKDGIPMLTPTASHEDVTKAGDNIFRACFLDPYQGSVMAQFAVENLGMKKLAVIYNTSDDYSAGLADAFETKVNELGGEITAIEGYGADDKDFKAQLTTIQGTQPDAVYVPDYYNNAALIIAQAREVGLDVPMLGPDGWDGVFGSIDASNMAALNDCYFSNHYFVGDPDPTVANFFKNYKEKYNEDPSALAALGYDGARILAQAIEKAGSTEKADIVAALAETQYSGVTGDVRYEGNGDPIKSLTIIRIVDGAYTLFDKVTP